MSGTGPGKSPVPSLESQECRRPARGGGSGCYFRADSTQGDDPSRTSTTRYSDHCGEVVTAESIVLQRRVALAPRIPSTFGRYLAVGGLSVIIDAGTLWLLYDVAHQHLWLATSAGFWLSFAFNFAANKYLTFSATTGGRRQLMRYAVLVAVSYSSNLAIVTGLVALGLPAVVGKLIAVALLVVVNFGAYRYWVFRD